MLYNYVFIVEALVSWFYGKTDFYSCINTAFLSVSASEVTTLWRYTNLFIIIIIISMQQFLAHVTCISVAIATYGMALSVCMSVCT